MVGSRVKRAALGFFALLAGCMESPEAQVRSAFEVDASCSPAETKIKRKWEGRYEASGCGKFTVYDCSGEVGCRPYTGVPGITSDDVVGKGKLFYSATLEPDALLKLMAWPEEDDAELGFDTTRGERCRVELVLDGDSVELERVKGLPNIPVPTSMLDDLGNVTQLSVKACDGEWALSKAQMADLHAFVRRFAEKAGKHAGEGGKKASASSRRAPHGGWPSWKGLNNFPNAAPGTAETLSGPQLFEKLSPSVLRVEAKRAAGFAQGSAVAIGPTLALTNCHVVEASQKIVLKQQEKEWIATLKESDPKGDRCVLEVANASWTPIGGVRAYADLKVGEPLYALGAPSGLDLTLTDGILSARREHEGVRYVQTTTPISPGSSGGGLFDARGNLVGITTLVFVGKERLNQSLNFAIAGEMFWSP
jgi:hypothetical protein